MKLELYYHNDCGFCRSVINTITNLKIGDKIELKNIKEDSVYEKELEAACGDTQVPTLVIDQKPMRESEDIKKFLVQNFM